MKKIPLTWDEMQGLTQEIIRQVHHSAWQPDYIVGLTRGGLVPAVLISQYLRVPMETLKVSLRDDGYCESNLWMAEDAFGYVGYAGREDPFTATSSAELRKNILIVDDINDSGATLNWIRADWQASCLPNNDEWNDIWGQNVRVAVLVHNESSKAWREPDFQGRVINKAEHDVWIDFPWETWWQS
jgi:xanthine phosphoribosyltransferase